MQRQAQMGRKKTSAAASPHQLLATTKAQPRLTNLLQERRTDDPTFLFRISDNGVRACEHFYLPGRSFVNEDNNGFKKSFSNSFFIGRVACPKQPQGPQANLPFLMI